MQGAVPRLWITPNRRIRSLSLNCNFQKWHFILYWQWPKRKWSMKGQKLGDPAISKSRLVPKWVQGIADGFVDQDQPMEDRTLALLQDSKIDQGNDSMLKLSSRGRSLLSEAFPPLKRRLNWYLIWQCSDVILPDWSFNTSIEQQKETSNLAEPSTYAMEVIVISLYSIWNDIRRMVIQRLAW